MNPACATSNPPDEARTPLKTIALFLAVFLGLFFLPVDSPRFNQALHEGLALTRWYAREHVILCLIPALFIAGAISVFVQQASVMRYLGPRAPKPLAYGVASVSGTILAVCSCTVLPLFAGIWRMGAGLGPAIAFLYSGPAINVLAIVLTARILGFELGLARALGAVGFSVVVGGLMHLIFLREERQKSAVAAQLPEAEAPRPLWQTALFFAAMVGVLVFANWGKPEEATGMWVAIHEWKWPITGAFAVLLAVALWRWLGFSGPGLLVTGLVVTALGLLFPAHPLVAFSAGTIGLIWLATRAGGEAREWLDATWGLARQILPLLVGGVFVAGVLLGRPGHEALIPSQWVSGAVGGNSLVANIIASVVGAFMYFATLTEVPILQGLLGAGMGQGPALALLLAGPALSLPNMLVLRSVMGTKKTAVYVLLVVVMATVTGLIYGAL
ncbi:MAG: hypothetical protein D6766_05460 [Verrucomicrobia bacterium]|nr:MAG: hypothetical protein D6766_05460 [Verrucomicrobiota bacterium]